MKISMRQLRQLIKEQLEERVPNPASPAGKAGTALQQFISTFGGSPAEAIKAIELALQNIKEEENVSSPDGADDMRARLHERLRRQRARR
jgi:hypothetical protein